MGFIAIVAAFWLPAATSTGFVWFMAIFALGELAIFAGTAPSGAVTSVLCAVDSFSDALAHWLHQTSVLCAVDLPCDALALFPPQAFWTLSVVRCLLLEELMLHNPLLCCFCLLHPQWCIVHCKMLVALVGVEKGSNYSTCVCFGR